MAEEPRPLDEASCRGLLGAQRFGRLGFVDDEGVMILPVNYRYADGEALIRTSAGSKLRAARHRDLVALEIDGADEERGSGWSVVARGPIEEVTDAEVVARAEDTVAPLAGGERPYVLRLSVEQLSGRRIPLRRGLPPAEHAWVDQDATDLLG